MSVVRLLVTALVMSGVAVALGVLAGDPLPAADTLRRAPEIAAAGGAEAVVLALTGLLAWATWAWGAAGLLLTAVGGLPGLPGAVARTVSRALLPERLRATAALALGMGLLVAGPAAAAPATPPGPPDWPGTTTGAPAPPDGPSDRAAAAPPAAAADQHVVVPGDCLWRIARAHLDRTGPPPADAATAEAVADWWSANAEAIGPDPDLIHPGQVLQAPPVDPNPAGDTR